MSAADRERALEPEDLERLATAAFLVGKDADSADTWGRAHQLFVSRGDLERAARCAFWLAFGLLHRGERARGGAWIARARRLLATRSTSDCVVRAISACRSRMQSLAEGDVAAAHATFCEAGEIGDRFGDLDLVALARHSRGRTLIRTRERFAKA